MKTITVAQSAGFCFGVDRAVQMVYHLLEEGKKVCTLGPIIHNPQMIAELESKGVEILQTVDEAPPGSTVVIRAHGVPRSTLDRMDSLRLDYADATCPFVSKIHALVSEASARGDNVFIIGNPKHPEVQGIQGHCTTPCFIFQSSQELEKFTKEFPQYSAEPVTIVAQTTFNVSEWENCLKIIKKVYTKATIFDTICNATVTRQTEAVDLAKRSDLMIIIGGKESSNTAKLYDVCAGICATYLIESADELPQEAVRKAQNISITAGASTPATIIKEVLDTMTVIHEPEQMEETSFAEMLEESLKSLNTDEKVRGVVVAIAPNEVQVDVGRKQAGFIPASELSSDPNVKPEDVVKIGDELDLLIMRTNDQEGTIMLSKKRLDAQKGWEVIMNAEEEGTVLKGVVTEVIKGA